MCKILCFWVGHDPNLIDRLFRKSKLFRKKWNKQHSSDGKTYGQLTIGKAIEATREVYNPRDEYDTLTQIAAQAELFHSPLKLPYATAPVRVGDRHFMMLLNSVGLVQGDTGRKEKRSKPVMELHLC